MATGLRLAWAFFELLAVLLRRRPGTIVAQNPPSFPTLPATWIVARLLGARLVLDWHNYGYSMLALRLGSSHLLTKLALCFEVRAGVCADDHFCVSEGMRKDLKDRFRVQAKVLYDRPAHYESFQAPQILPMIVVCPSGWTADEDMNLLLDALGLLEPGCFEFHLTGDGPARAQLGPRIRSLRDSGIAIHADFLPEREYRNLLRRATAGLSLHRSSSSLDLPMKIVDFFGAGLPVCALDYGPTLREQVSTETGFFFGTASELAEIFRRLERDRTPLDRKRCAIRAQWTTTWSEEWRKVAGPVFGVSDEP